MKHIFVMTMAGAVLVAGCKKKEDQATAPAKTEMAVEKNEAERAPEAAADVAVAPVVEKAPAQAPVPVPVSTVAAEEPKEIKTVEDVHAALKSANPSYQNNAQVHPKLFAMSLSNTFVSDLRPIASMKLMMLDLRGLKIDSLEPLAGMPLQELYLEETQVKDLLPLKGLQLTKLYLSKSNVTDLAPLAGMPLTELNLVGTQITDLEPLRDMPLSTLWLSECPATSISPLGSCPLVSLTLHRTQVKDLEPLKNIQTLLRLHIGETPVEDLTPLLGLNLNRLTFTPGSIKLGLDGLRSMTSLQGLATQFDSDVQNVLAPAKFWEQYDKGLLK